MSDNRRDFAAFDRPGTRMRRGAATIAATLFSISAPAQEATSSATTAPRAVAQSAPMAGITNLTIAAGERPAPAPPRPAYVDQLIEGVAREDEAPAAAEPGDLTPGLRVWSTEFVLDHREVSDIGATTSPGVALRHRRETEQYGDFVLEADVARGERFPSEPRLTRGRFTLFHDQFALSDSWTASSVLGTWRSAISPWLSSSYRINLPSSLAAGAFTTVTGRDSELRAGVGRIGRLVGMSVQGFEALDGTVASADYSKRLRDGTLLGGGVVSIQGSRDVPDHVAATLAADIPVTLPGMDGRMKLQAAMDDNGETGFWADGRVKSGRFNHRIGAYRMAPDLLFGEITPQKDSRGVYWRGDMRASAMTANAGLDLSSTNLDRNPARGGSDATEGYGNLSLRLDRSTSVGAGLSLRDDRPRTATGLSSRRGAVSGWVSRVTPWGVARFDANYTRTNLDGRADVTRYYAWSHEWPLVGGMVSPSTLVTYTNEQVDGRPVRRTSANLLMRGDLLGPTSWSVSLTAVDVDDGEDSERNYNSAVSLDWQASPEWLVRLQWQRNQIQPTASSALVPFTKDNTLILSARFEAIGGTPYPRVAAVGGRSGTGSIAGTLFFDENRDGKRQPTERGAGGVTVLLDGRQMQVTDAEGRFSFALVPPGEHRVSVVLERIPLPWGLEDEAPRPVAVQVREDARIEIGLTRVAP